MTGVQTCALPISKPGNLASASNYEQSLAERSVTEDVPQKDDDEESIVKLVGDAEEASADDEVDESR